MGGNVPTDIWSVCLSSKLTSCLMQGCRFVRFFGILPIFLPNCRTFHGKSAKLTNDYFVWNQRKTYLVAEALSVQAFSGISYHSSIVLFSKFTLENLTSWQSTYTLLDSGRKHSFVQVNTKKTHHRVNRKSGYQSFRQYYRFVTGCVMDPVSSQHAK